MADKRDELEIWRNVGNGLTWVMVLNPQGGEVTKEVRGGQTFTIKPFDRQMNQYQAATPGQDMFRNGRLILIKAATDTELDEIESAESLTDQEILDIVHNSIKAPNTINRVLGKIKSPTTLLRLQEELLLEDEIPQGVADKVKQAIKVAEGRDKVVERERV